MKSQLKKISQKIATKIGIQKYEKVVDTPKLKVKKQNASILKQLSYDKLEWTECKRFEIN